MGQFVIACYKPREGKESELEELVKKHMKVLLEEGFVTDRPAYAMRAANGTIVEVFEWKSPEAIASAHSNDNVRALWTVFEQACYYETLSNLEEAQQIFAPFEPIEH